MASVFTGLRGVNDEIAVLSLPMKKPGYSIRFGVVFLLILAMQGLPPVQALQVTGLYSKRVELMNESDADRNRAFREALAAVILKVTGDPRYLEDPAVLRALNNAQSYVEAISYSTETVEIPLPQAPVTSGTDPAPLDGDALTAAASAGAANPDGNPQAASPAATPVSVTRQRRTMNVDFAAGLIDRMLIDAGIPIWNSNRPSVMVWMALQNDEGERRLLTGEEAEIIDTIRQFGETRGVPIIFPVLDFEDRRNLSADLVWTLDEEAIRRASARYAADSMLAGRLHFTASGELVGLWQFIFQDEVTVFDGFSTELADYLEEPLNRVTTELASYFAILPESAATQYVRLRVDGVSDLQDYSSLITYVSNLGLVQSVAPAMIQGDRLELQLGLAGSSRQLHELIALDRDLLPIASSQGRDDSLLHYRWTR